VLRKLAEKHNLRTIGRDKACMYVEDLNLVLQTNLRTVEKKYSHGRYRIQAQLYLQLGGFTANRPGALLSLCYRHIQVTLLRDPEGGPHRILLEFTFEFTKQFLGIKDMLVLRFLSVQDFTGLLIHSSGINFPSPRSRSTRPLHSVPTSSFSGYSSTIARLQLII
jgi:hypothetical protein